MGGVFGRAIFFGIWSVSHRTLDWEFITVSLMALYIYLPQINGDRNISSTLKPFKVTKSTETRFLFLSLMHDLGVSPSLHRQHSLVFACRGMFALLIWSFGTKTWRQEYLVALRSVRLYNVFVCPNRLVKGHNLFCIHRGPVV